MSSGIYQIQNQINRKRYIGSAVNLEKRWWNHLSSLRHNSHHNPHLQAAFHKYGEDAFAVSVLEYVEDLEQLIVREQYFLGALSPEYNISPTAGSSLGIQHSASFKKRVSQSLTGRRLSEETKRKISEAMKGERGSFYGKQHTDESKLKMSKVHKGKTLSVEHRRKISEANRRRTHSEETKRKISMAQKAHWRRLRARISEGAGG